MSHVRFVTRKGKHVGVVDRDGDITIEVFPNRPASMQGRILLALSTLDALTLAELLTNEVNERRPPSC